MKSKLLKSYKGFMIEKSWKEQLGRGRQDILYTAYTKDGSGVFDADKTLSGLKKKINKYINHNKTA